MQAPQIEHVSASVGRKSKRKEKKRKEEKELTLYNSYICYINMYYIIVHYTIYNIRGSFSSFFLKTHLSIDFNVIRGSGDLGSPRTIQSRGEDGE